MEDVKGYKGSERRAYPRFYIIFPAFLRLSVIKDGNSTILELGGETVDISLEGVKVLIPEKADVLSSIEDAKEGRGVDVGVEIITEKKRIKAVGDVRWFKVEVPEEVTVGIHLKGMGRDDREIWEDLVKSVALSLQETGGIKHYSSDIFTELKEAKLGLVCPACKSTNIQRIMRKT